ncbi:MAG: T9SS type A sorting domain-containing protein [Saprospiraceae bacterium]|nr:T9SS type A sorting domain-containing protein [Saprospiraceae bacterium]
MMPVKVLFKTPRCFFLFFALLISLGQPLVAQSFPEGGSCPSIASGCASPAITSITEVPPSCANARDYKLRIEFAAGGTTSDPSAFRDHYWVMQVITKDSCVYLTDPFTVGTTSGPTYVRTTGNSLIVDVAPGDLTYVTGGTNCMTTDPPTLFGGLDSVYVSIQQRCDDPGSGCSPFSTRFGEAIPFSFDMITSKSNFQSVQDSSMHGYCTDNRIIYVDALQGEEETFNLSWYKDYQQTSQFVYVCLQDWAPIAVAENYELELTYSTNLAFNQTVANGWVETGDSIKVTTEEVNGQTCHKITYSFDGDGMINTSMNSKITAKAIGSNCETVTAVAVDTAATAYNKIKIGWRANMQTTNHQFKLRIYQGGSCNMTMMNPDTASTRPNIDNSYIHEILIGSNNDRLSKFTVQDTIAGNIYMTDSFTLDLSSLGISLEGCTCFQAFVFQVCDGTNTGTSPRWSTGVNATTDCNSCEDGIQNGFETGIDCGGYCEPCGGLGGTSTCEDGLQNGDETGVDCGGSCAPCEPAPTCEDGLQNGDETGVDCGGSCIPCEPAPTCEDGIQNGDETGIDCGGSCAPCVEVPAPTCEDGTQNGDETGVDCGGSCAPCFVCPATEGLRVTNFARGRVTLNWEPVEDATMYNIQIRLEGASTWYDFRTRQTSQTIRGLARSANYEWRIGTMCSEQTGSWTDICTFNSNDPATGQCGAAVVPTCEDGIQNGDETGVDCGGSCVPCEPAPTCEDGIQNGDETGVDCGGSCTSCTQEPAPTCEDGTQNGDETGVDCGGSCAPCQEDNGCPVPSDLRQLALGSSAILSWISAREASQYILQIRLQGTETWTTYRTNINRYMVSRLQRGQVYEWQVQSVCGETSSDWSPAALFVAGRPGSASGVNVNPTATATTIQVYPNPASEILNVVVPTTVSGVSQISILDLSGKRWLSQSITDGSSTLQINVSNLPKGIYLLRHENQEQVTLQRVIIQ